MTEQKTLPALLFDDYGIFPGQTLSAKLDIIKLEENETLYAAVTQYNNYICLGKTLLENSTCFYCQITSYAADPKSNKIILELQIKQRAKFISTVDDICASIEVYTDALETDEQKNLFSEIKSTVLNDGNFYFYFVDKTIIPYMFKPDTNPSETCDIIIGNLLPNLVDEKKVQKFITSLDFTERLKMTKEIVNELSKQSKIDQEVEAKTQEAINKEQKEYYLRKKIRIIQEELGDVDKISDDAEKIREKIDKAGMTREAKDQALKELKRYQSTISASPEASMIRQYLDTLVSIPWKKETKDNLNIAEVKAKLDETHSGLEKIKERILDYLAVKLYSKQTPQTIICFAGPPGVGKTTLAKSIAEALGRKFVKQSLGGVKDEAEIRGHRRTYLGALPGRIINGIKEAKVVNPVFLLDEIDKLGADYKGDPSASLLEVLDPNQNQHFMDHYLELEYDLSKVMFICTANDLSKVPAPLRDRMEIIELSSYTEIEKLDIAKNHIVDNALKNNGLEKEKFEITDSGIKEIIKYYTREAGARQLDRCINSIVRKAIKEIMSTKNEKIIVDENKVKEYLGKEIYNYNITEQEDLVGVVNGLAYTQAGGDVLQIECLISEGKSEIEITGNLGDVMKESVKIAKTWVEANHSIIGIRSNFNNKTVHIHCPEGATPKEGPSAGVTLAVAITSALSNRKVKHDIGMTGELTLRGRVLPIGGLREKSIAAYRSGLKTIFIPKENIKDLDEVPDEVKENLNIIPVSHVTEIISHVLI